ncbi:MAG: pantoate--beta-alanine ligase [Actinomycetota bacterium]|nr:pantoate--beta-alanine ligase [Actinomycetota bacterium]
MLPVVARTRADIKSALDGAGSVAFVPTMGALHGGHVQLLKHAAPLADTLVASIFVNPTQFAPGEDFSTYPRTMDEDLRICAEAGVSVVFAPDVDTMYPGGTEGGTTVDPGPLGTILEGKTRPTHFRGVLTVVSKLFGLLEPDVAVFGEKDYQQLALIRLMVQGLCMDTEVVGCPTVREADGLAMSSRNRYLSPEQRQQAVALSRALNAGLARASGGADAVLAAAHGVINDAPGVDLDYLVLTNPDLGTLSPERQVPGQEARLLIEGRVGTTRLIDNTGLTLGS